MVERKNIVSPRKAIQDGVHFELQNVLDALAWEMKGQKAVFVFCPICSMDASVPILIGRELQTVNCRHCGSELKFKLMVSGAYKVRSELGLEYVVGTERTWREKVF